MSRGRIRLQIRRSLSRNPHLLPNYARTIKRTIPPLHISRLLATNTADSPKEPRLAPGNANAEAQTGGRRCAHGNAPRSQDVNANAPLPSVSLERRQASAATGRARTASTRDNANVRQRQASAATGRARAASYSKYLATPTGMHWRMRPTSSASSKSMPWSNQWRVQPAQPFEKKSKQNPVPPLIEHAAHAHGHRTRRAAHDASRDTGCSRPGR